jgi:WD40 repeat protein/bifunctional DNA primase/polymerase-like protein
MAEAVGIPPLEDHNRWADYWYYEVGVNVIPAHTKQKKTFVEWKRWQIESIPEELHDQWKSEKKFADGMAIILGKVWRGDHIGEYLIFIDLDNQKAIEEFCGYFSTSNGQPTTLNQIAEKFIVEQHLDDTDKAHVFFYSEVMFPKKSSDVNIPGEKNDDLLPAIEIKGLGTHGIAYCTPSVHKKGQRYQIIGTARPVKLSEDQARRMIENIDNNICKKHGLHYLDYDDGSGNALVPMTDLFRDEYVIVANHNRHGALLRVMESLIKRLYGLYRPDEIRELAYKWNQKHCQPPLDDKEFEKQWRDAAKFILSKIKEEEKQQEEERKPVIELTEELTKEVSWNEISQVLDSSIKKDPAAKIISFDNMLLAQTNEDQLNIGFQAESSAGKSYVPLEVSQYFPVKEVDIIASASPTAENGFNYYPTWSPDGTKIAFSSERPFGSFEIFTMNADGSNEQRLTNDPFLDVSPSWSPDGTKIAFETDRDEPNHPRHIYVMNADGSDQHNISTNPFGDLQPDWSLVAITTD